jgi:hypothetical protein
MRLREVTDDDLDELYAQQADRVSYEMAAVPTRDRPAFDAHWQMLRADPEVLLRVHVFRPNRASARVLEKNGSSRRSRTT